MKNFEKYKTADERVAHFARYCALRNFVCEIENNNWCDNCCIPRCAFNWLDREVTNLDVTPEPSFPDAPCMQARNAYRPFVFNVKRKWYDLMASGKENIKYCEITPYWSKRLMLFKRGREIVFRSGYGTSYEMRARLDWVDIGACPYKGCRGKYYKIHFTPIWSKCCSHFKTSQEPPVSGMAVFNRNNHSNNRRIEESKNSNILYPLPSTLYPLS